MTAYTPLPVEHPGAGPGSLSRDPARSFERWPEPASTNHAARWHHWRARRAHRGRRIFRRVAMVLATLFVLHTLVVSLVWLRWVIPLLLLGLAARRALSALRARRLQRPWTPASASLSELPRHTHGWLAHVRTELPSDVEPVLDRLSQRLDALAQQPKAITGPSEASDALRRLLAEELPELVHGYLRVPRALARTPLQGRATPERQLIDGLGILDTQLAALHERLAEQDLNALATHLQYLRLKYGSEQALSPARRSE